MEHILNSDLHLKRPEYLYMLITRGIELRLTPDQEIASDVVPELDVIQYGLGQQSDLNPYCRIFNCRFKFDVANIASHCYEVYGFYNILDIITHKFKYTTQYTGNYYRDVLASCYHGAITEIERGVYDMRNQVKSCCINVDDLYYIIFTYLTWDCPELCVSNKSRIK